MKKIQIFVALTGVKSTEALAFRHFATAIACTVMIFKTKITKCNASTATATKNLNLWSQGIGLIAIFIALGLK